MAQNYRYAGEKLQILESLLVHPTHSDGFVNSGDPCYVGVQMGVALISADAATDYVTVATKGVFDLAVVGSNGGNVAVSIGDRLYISTGGIVNKTTGGKAFGIAMGAVESGATTTIPVKVCGAGN